MFLGTYEPRLDEKGRLILPAKVRDELAGGVVLTRGQEPVKLPRELGLRELAALLALIAEHSGARFSHGICPDCQVKLYGEIIQE